MNRPARATQSERDIPQQAVAALGGELGDRLVAVIVFGSRARGDHRPESDWDLLVIAEGLPERPFERHLYLAGLLPLEWGGEVTIMARTPEEYEAHLPSLYLDIAFDGKILYDPHGYAAQRLAALRRLIERAGLYREQTDAGDIWRWRQQPSEPWTLEWELTCLPSRRML